MRAHRQTHARLHAFTYTRQSPPPPTTTTTTTKNTDPRPKPRNPQVGAVQLDALTNLFGANCQWETSARTAVDKTGCWGEQIPLHEGGGQLGANVLMCGRWLGRYNGRISQSPGWLIWDGSSQPLAVGSPIVPLLIPTSHKLQTKVNLFLKGGKNIDPCFSWGKWLKNLFARDDWLCNSPSTLYVFFPSLGVLFMCSLYWPAVVSKTLNDPSFSDSSGAGGTCWKLRGGFAAEVINIKIYRDAITGWSEIGLMSPLGSLSGWTSAFSHSWRAFFSFSVFSFSFFPPWKDSLTNYDSWVEGLSLFRLQRQTCESRGARDVISVSTVHLLFCLWCVKVFGFPELKGHVSVMQRWLDLIRSVGELYRPVSLSVFKFVLNNKLHLVNEFIFHLFVSNAHLKQSNLWLSFCSYKKQAKWVWKNDTFDHIYPHFQSHQFNFKLFIRFLHIQFSLF